MEKIPFNEANQIKGGGVPIVLAECIAFTGDSSGLELISKNDYPVDDATVIFINHAECIAFADASAISA